METFSSVEKPSFDLHDLRSSLVFVQKKQICVWTEALQMAFLPVKVLEMESDGQKSPQIDLCLVLHHSVLRSG